jgi:DNA polymerase III delta subunit
MSVATFDAWFGRGEPLPASIYVSGGDEAAKTEVLAALKQRWAEERPDVPPVVLRAGEVGVDRVLAEAQGASLFVPASFVIVLNVEEWTRSARTVEAAATGTVAVPQGNVLVYFESAAENERKTLVPLSAACALRVAVEAPPPEVLARWAERRLARSGVKPGPGVIEAVLDASRLETSEVMNEVDKLADWAASAGKVSREEAEQVLRPVHSGSLTALSRAVAEGRSDAAVDHLLRALEAGESEGTVLFQLQTLVAGALRMRTHQWGWIRDRENSDRLARSRGATELSAALDLLYRTERAWKSGRADVETLLVRAVVGLSEGA